MRVYTMSKNHMATVLSVFALVIFTFFILGLTGPPMTAMVSVKYSEMNASEGSDLVTGPFRLLSPAVSPHCRHLWLMTQIVPNSNTDTEFLHASYRSRFQVSVEIWAMDTSSNRLSNDSKITGKQTRQLNCVGQKCEAIVIGHLGSLQFGRYEFMVRFFHLQDFADKLGINDVLFHFKSYHPTFTRFELLIRFLLVIVTFIVALFYYQYLCPYFALYWTVEQKWLAVLLPLLFFYNNPLFPMVFITTGSFGIIFEGVFQATFLCTLLLFWLCIYHGIGKNKRPFVSFYGPKLCLTGTIWLCALLLTILDGLNDLKNPAFYGDDTERATAIQMVKTVSCVCGAIYVVALLFWMVRGFREVGNRSCFEDSTRLKLLLTVTTGTVAASACLAARGYGFSSSLRHYFLSRQPIQSRHQSPVYFSLSYSILNSYIFILAYVYIPALNAPSLANELAVYDNLNCDPSNRTNDSEDDIFHGATDYFTKGKGRLSSCSSSEDEHINLFAT